MIELLALMSQCIILSTTVVNDRYIVHNQVCQETTQGGWVYTERLATLIIDTKTKRGARVTGFLSFE